MKIMLDMDGVIADFEGHYISLFGETPAETKEKGSGKRFKQNWEFFVGNKEFQNIPMLDDAPELLSFINSLNVPVEILSSAGGRTHWEEVEEQKLIWLNEHGVVYNKANIVQNGARKAEFAAPWNILVDDTDRVVTNYKKHGGTTILHVGATNTIAKLRELHLEWLGSV